MITVIISLIQKLIIKSIALTNAAELLQMKSLKKPIMKKKQGLREQKGYAKAKAVM
jgi:predicted HTH domain antitoxin